ncbi:MAG: tetratricopeptide repeat protein [Phycisphaerales bacterium]
MDNAARIAQFENMTQADPSNEMAHFSLGRAYAEAGRHADAAKAYLRCIELVPDMSKAYQLAGESLVKAGEPERAKSVLRRDTPSRRAKATSCPSRPWPSRSRIWANPSPRPPAHRADRRSISQGRCPRA